MVVIIDPGLFLVSKGSGALPSQEDLSLRERLSTARRVLKELVSRGAFVATRRLEPVGAGVESREYDAWGLFQHTMIRPLSKRLTRETQQEVDQLRELVTRHPRLLKLPSVRGGVCYGVRALFEYSAIDPALREEWAKLVCAATAEPEEVVVLGALVLGRNAVDCSSADGTELIERTRWRVYAHLEGRSPVAIDVLVHPRNIDERWTTRFDERLPARGPCPFCVPSEWHLLGTRAWMTRESKPCWVDANDLSWARPRTGGGYHWDVFLKNNRAINEEARVDQVNIVQHGAPKEQGEEGSIHHAGDKKGRLNEQLSWRCPCA